MALSVAIFFLKYQKKMLQQEQRELEQEIKAKERQRLQEQMHQRLLMESIVQAQEKEQRRIAEDLHDEVGADLALTRMGVSHLARLCSGNRELVRLSEEISKKMTQINNRIREISHDLLPSVVEDSGILKGLRQLSKHVTTASGIQFIFHTDDLVDLPLEKRHEMMLYRIVQELVHNSFKYANATELELDLEKTDSELLLFYHDNGCGISGPEVLTGKSGDGGLGLRSLAGRLELLNGSYNIRSAPGEGFSIRIRIPLPIQSVQQE